MVSVRKKYVEMNETTMQSNDLFYAMYGGGAEA